MTFKHLTADYGVELLTLCLEDFRVKTSQSQEKEMDLTESDQECGEKWQGSFTRYDRDSCSWKTHQCSFLEDLTEFSETWPRWGLMRGGECWERQALEQTTNEKESGLWRTPDTGAGGTSGLLKQGKTHRENGQPIQIRLVDQVNNPHLWPTPRSCSAMAATITPESAWNPKRNPNLETIVGQRLWPTPVARMWKDSGCPSEYRRNEVPLAAQVGGQLNPTWVEWLMGWPLGWTDLKPLGMDKSHSVPQQLGKS
jgi:hypothetical protein